MVRSFVVGLMVLVLVLFAAAWLSSPTLVPRPWLLAVVIALATGALSLAWLRRAFSQRVQPTWDEEFPDAPRARVTPGGEFTWEPRGTPRMGVRHGIVHRWWDVTHAPRVGVALAFEIPDELPRDLLLAATKRGLAAARRALPGRGKVRAKAAGRDEPGPTSFVRVRLEVQGHGADEDWARASAEAFARAFLRAVARHGMVATQR